MPSLRPSGRFAKPCLGQGSIAPGLTISRIQEVQHLGIFGTPGAGKSLIIYYLTEQLLARGERITLNDTKGDVTACLPSSDFVLLAPQDQRGIAWDVAQDIVTAQDARELAARLITASHDPMWSSAAREILSGIIILYLARPLGLPAYRQKIMDRRIQHASDLKQLGGPHSVGALFVFLDLLERQTKRFSKALLRHTAQRSAKTDARTNMGIDGAGSAYAPQQRTFFCNHDVQSLLP